jgi:hydroxyacyl-ACP dehydratase HTD2-like protein with hotdog domain
MATFLTDLLETSAAAPLRRFAFRSMSPMFAGGTLSVNATAPDGEGRSSLWIATEGDRLVMEAQAWL